MLKEEWFMCHQTSENKKKLAFEYYANDFVGRIDGVRADCQKFHAYNNLHCLNMFEMNLIKRAKIDDFQSQCLPSDCFILTEVLYGTVYAFISIWDKTI